MNVYPTHASVRLKRFEDNYEPVLCAIPDCPKRPPHFHCPFCVKTDVFHEETILKAHYRVKHVDKGIDFADLKILRCCDRCEIVGTIKGQKAFKGAHWHCYKCRNGFNRRDEALKHYKTHFRNPQTTFQIQLQQDINQMMYVPQHPETVEVPSEVLGTLAEDGTFYMPGQPTSAWHHGHLFVSPHDSMFSNASGVAIQRMNSRDTSQVELVGGEMLMESSADDEDSFQARGTGEEGYYILSEQGQGDSVQDIPVWLPEEISSVVNSSTSSSAALQPAAAFPSFLRRDKENKVLNVSNTDSQSKEIVKYEKQVAQLTHELARAKQRICELEAREHMLEQQLNEARSASSGWQSGQTATNDNSHVTNAMAADPGTPVTPISQLSSSQGSSQFSVTSSCTLSPLPLSPEGPQQVGGEAQQEMNGGKEGDRSQAQVDNDSVGGNVNGGESMGGNNNPFNTVVVTFDDRETPFPARLVKVPVRSAAVRKAEGSAGVTSGNPSPMKLMRRILSAKNSQTGKLVLKPSPLPVRLSSPTSTQLATTTKASPNSIMLSPDKARSTTPKRVTFKMTQDTVAAVDYKVEDCTESTEISDNINPPYLPVDTRDCVKAQVDCSMRVENTGTTDVKTEPLNNEESPDNSRDGSNAESEIADSDIYMSINDGAGSKAFAYVASTGKLGEVVIDIMPCRSNPSFGKVDAITVSAPSTKRKAPSTIVVSPGASPASKRQHLG